MRQNSLVLTAASALIAVLFSLTLAAPAAAQTQDTAKDRQIGVTAATPTPDKKLGRISEA